MAMIICSVTSRDGLSEADMRTLENQIEVAQSKLRPKTKLTWIQTCAGGVAPSGKPKESWGHDKFEFYVVTLTCIVERSI